LIENTAWRAIVLALGAGVACAGAIACTHDFAEFHVSADASGGDQDGALATDGGVPPMVDANLPFDAGIDAPPPCTPSASCLTSAHACAATCLQQDSMCRGMCGGNQGCLNRCTQKLITCEMPCETTCAQCTQSAGCAAQQACADASTSP
jgi:hypothetical protein